MKLKNQVAIVTAAAGAGIGQAVVRRFAAEGAHVVISDAHAKRPLTLAEELSREHGREFLGLQVDATDKPQVERMVQMTVEKYGRVDILVNNAGINKLEPAWEMSAETWDFVIRTNLYSTFYCTRAVLPHMVNQRSGKIVSLASVAGWIGSSDGEAHYCAAKAAVMGYTRAVAAEVGKYGIRVNAIAPGLIYNEFLRRIYPDDMFKSVEKRTPLGRVGKPEDIANLALFLVSDESSFITGEVMCCSGGLYVHA
ncbi:MAG: 3-oxoacyl-ACP reductase family protein [Thermodesulfobacteriota bacterium]|jgi:3-oxoacyl-[acyl-carrier protein] reductase